ncbi:MAG: glycosyltransferase family 2 protein [Mycobacteriaceae bacterium]
MKLVVQVPCLNEEETLPAVLGTIPRHIEGIDVIEVVVIDDGSTDRTVEVARAHGVDHVVHHTRNMGLARSFRDGVDHALSVGADIVVNTDGDNQYPQGRIPDLVAPILAGRADIVIGDRQTAEIAHFSWFKKRMQAFGSQVVNRAAGTDLPDAASGFRAYSRASLMRLNVLTQFSYCMETIIQAGNRRMRIESVPIETNPKTRESRLFTSIWHHMAASGAAIARSVLMFRPYVLLATLAAIFGVLGLVPFVRYLVLAITGDAAGHVQSLIFGAAMLAGAFLVVALLVIADLQRTNRILLEETLERTKWLQYEQLPAAGAPAPPMDTAGAPAPAMDTAGAPAINSAGAPAPQGLRATAR